jgi:hypothetical protein
MDVNFALAVIFPKRMHGSMHILVEMADTRRQLISL